MKASFIGWLSLDVCISFKGFLRSKEKTVRLNDRTIIHLSFLICPVPELAEGKKKAIQLRSFLLSATLLQQQLQLQRDMLFHTFIWWLK